ncbi:MAG: SDR family oxidoreductase [Proteobacteria bacterium]|nr:SDR family oxidoreductase [Pseudomonadota bacterium]MCP4921326.1 SDR family oxidoreductase [Pseudomonadota bacterium]
MSDGRRWILVLGASSGFGAATCRHFAKAGYDILGVHLDRKVTLPNALAVQADVEAEGRLCRLFNVNAADDDRRAEVLDAIAETVALQGGTVEVLLHSLAFGSLLSFVGEGRNLKPRQLTMTLEVMANSLIWWSRDLVDRELMGSGGRIFSMTSSGSVIVFPTYGAVSAAKAALESHTRQLAVELAPMGIRCNAIMAGVTDTPALRKIPGNDDIVETALRRNPSGRITQPDDVASALVDLARPGLSWMTGNVIRIDGGEGIVA